MKYIKFGDAAEQVIRNSSTNGNAWFVTDLVEVNSPDEEISALANINTANQAVIDKSKFASPRGKLSSGRIRLDEYKPNYLKYSSSNQERGLAVFSEIYYPAGWIALIDDSPVEIVRVNYLLRAVEIPSGNHKVEFYFRPDAYHIGNSVMLGSSMILLLTLLTTIVIEIKNLSIN